jgi:O-antigen/teichoic acid export membrane protein
MIDAVLITFRKFIPILASNRSTGSVFARDLGGVLIGVILSQIVPVISIPLIAEVFEPSVYGQYALVMSITTVFAVIACGRMELAIALPKSDSEAGAVLQACLLIASAIATCSFVFAIIAYLFFETSWTVIPFSMVKFQRIVFI